MLPSITNTTRSGFTAVATCQAARAHPMSVRTQPACAHASVSGTACRIRSGGHTWSCVCSHAICLRELSGHWQAGESGWAGCPCFVQKRHAGSVCQCLWACPGMHRLPFTPPVLLCLGPRLSIVRAEGRIHIHMRWTHSSLPAPRLEGYSGATGRRWHHAGPTYLPHFLKQGRLLPVASTSIYNDDIPACMFTHAILSLVPTPIYH